MPSCPATDSIRAGDDGRPNPEKQGDGTMTDTWTADIAWWITAVELPALGGLFWLIWRTRRDGETALDAQGRRADAAIAQLREGLAAYKLEVAKNYTSMTYRKDVERRPPATLMSIEIGRAACRKKV